MANVLHHVNNGVTEAMIDLASAYMSGEHGAVRSGKRVLKLLERAVELGDPTACLHLGVLLYDGMTGVKINRKRSKLLFARVAALGHAEAYFRVAKSGGHVLGRSYQLKYFRLAADLGHAKAKANLAMMYELSGPGQDLVEARHLYESAATKGYAPAQNALSRLDTHGLG